MSAATDLAAASGLDSAAATRVLQILSVPLECTDSFAIELLERLGHSSEAATQWVRTISQTPLVVADRGGWRFVSGGVPVLDSSEREVHAMIAAMSVNARDKTAWPSYLRESAGIEFHNIMSQRDEELLRRMSHAEQRLGYEPRDVFLLGTLLRGHLMRAHGDRDGGLLRDLKHVAADLVARASREARLRRRVLRPSYFSSSSPMLAVLVLAALCTIAGAGLALGWFR